MSDQNNDYAEAHPRFAQNVQVAAEQNRQSGANPNTGLPLGQSHPSQEMAPAVNVNMLAEADRLQAARDDSGRRPYEYDEAYRNKVEQLRQQAFGADPAQPYQSMPQAPTELPLEPQGSPGERLAEHLQNGGQISRSEVNDGTWDALTAGYDVNLPEGYVLAGEHVEMLHTARAAGVTQDIIDRYIAEALKD